MARKIGCVCYYAVCVVILVFILTPADTTSSRDVHVDYSVPGLRRDFHTEVHNLEDDLLVRVKRQESPDVSAVSPSSNSSNNNSSPISTPAPVTTQSPRPSPTTQKATTTTPHLAHTTTTTTTTKKPTTTPAPQPQPQPPASRTTTPQPRFIEDNHNYYKSTIYPGYADDHYVELDNPHSQDTLNSGHRLAVTVSLPFKFRFYGHNITNVTIATGGFIYMSPFLHQWLTATQYIAPLMANFDTSTSADSNIFYKQVGEEFVIEWHNVLLKDQAAQGNFIFQAKLKNDGTITFVYKSLPIAVRNISSTNHPVKIGLSDAFYNDTFLPQYGIKRRTIIEYHRVAFMKEQIEEGTVIILTPLPTCNVISDCGTCTEHTGVKFDCKWCERVSRCSDGLDWYRQDWEKQGCKSSSFDDSELCYHVSTSKPTTVKSMPTKAHGTPHSTTSDIPAHPHSTAKPRTPHSTTPHITARTLSTPDITVAAGSSKDNCGNTNDGSCDTGRKSSPLAAILAVVLVLVVLIGSVGVWVFYAYTHPTSPSGIWLMEHRPSQMKTKLANMKFWKKSTPAGTKYAVETEA